MKQPARGLACIVFGAVACSAAVAEAGPAILTPEKSPVVLTEGEMDDAVAGANWRNEVASRFLSRIWHRLNSGVWRAGPGTTVVQSVQISSGDGSTKVTAVSRSRSYQYSSEGD